MKKAAVAFGLAIGLLLAVLLVRTTLFESRQVPPEKPAPVQIDVEQAAKRLSHAIQFQTISSRDGAGAPAGQFNKLHEHIVASFPQVHSQLKRETINESSLLYTWSGKDPVLPAILLAAHLDVVPAEADQWAYPPFAGEIAGNFLWGRGALDDKASVMAILEAVEALLQSGFIPPRSIYLAFGHDEEVGGANGAAAIASLLRSRNVALEFVLDEGGAVTRGIIPLESPVATIGIAEKGYLTLELSAAGASGHSMNPPPRTTIGTLARAVARLEAHPFPARISGATRDLFEHIGPEMPFLQRAVFANLWLFSPLVEQRLAQAPATNAAIRTTIAATIFQAGTRENVLPAEASATINFRLLLGDSVDEVISKVREIIDDDGVGVEILGKAFEPSPVASAESAAYVHLARTIRAIFPHAIAAPYLVPGATDARHYAPLAENVYRFLAVPLTSEDLKRFHGVNERIALDDYARLVGFYHEFIATLN